MYGSEPADPIEQPGGVVDAELNELDDAVVDNVTSNVPSKRSPGHDD